MTPRAPAQQVPFAMTVDVEDWYTAVATEPAEIGAHADRLHVGMGRLLDLLDESQTRATFFFLGYLAERHPQLVREVAQRGHELAVHGYYHTALWHLDAERLRLDLRRTCSAIRQASGVEPKGFRAPYFSVTRRTLWALDVVADEGFDYDASIFPIRNPRYGLSGAPRRPHLAATGRPLLEFPMSTIGADHLALPFSGGFYLRALPYTLIHKAFFWHRRAGLPAICYVHPWELDDQQPTLQTGALARLRHTVGLGGTAEKLRKLLRSFQFGRLDQLVERVRSASASGSAPSWMETAAPGAQGYGRRAPASSSTRANV